MPYHIERHGKKFNIVRDTDGKVVGSSDTREKAESSIRARLAGEHGWKGTKRKKK
jgi:hypothetical protein